MPTATLPRPISVRPVPDDVGRRTAVRSPACRRARRGGRAVGVHSPRRSRRSGRGLRRQASASVARCVASLRAPPALAACRLISTIAAVFHARDAVGEAKYAVVVVTTSNARSGAARRRAGSASRLAGLGRGCWSVRRRRAARLVHQGPRDRDALLLAAAERPGSASSRPASPTRSSTRRRRASAARDAGLRKQQGTATLSSAVSAGSRLKDWKTKPMSVCAGAHARARRELAGPGQARRTRRRPVPGWR